MGPFGAVGSEFGELVVAILGIRAVMILFPLILRSQKKRVKQPTTVNIEIEL